MLLRWQVWICEPENLSSKVAAGDRRLFLAILTQAFFTRHLHI